MTNGKEEQRMFKKLKAGFESLKAGLARTHNSIMGSVEAAFTGKSREDILEALEESLITRHSDIIILDAAGRLHTKVNLMEEFKKVKKVAGRELPGAPHENLLVLDSSTGQNAINQARLFNEAVGVTGIALTKLDGTAKGGII